MDRNFARSLVLVLKSEGGWSDNPADPGGATMKGVTLATFRAYIKPGGTKVDLRAITDEQLSACYRRQYWDAVAGDQLPDGVDYAVFDFAVNSGPGRAAKYLQRVVGTTPDGTIGPATIAAASSLPAGAVLDRLCDLRLEFLKSLGTWATFGKGWASRVASVRKDALLMSYRAPQAAPPAPVAPAAAPVPPKLPSRATVGVLVLLGTALATWSHQLAAWLHSFL
jgi:lysozyme family protein